MRLQMVSGFGLVLQPIKSLVGKEQGSGESAVRVGQGDRHFAAPRPNVQRARIERMPSLSWRKFQLLVRVPQWFCHALATLQGLQRLANHTPRAVCTDDQVGFQALFAEVHGFAVVA